MSDAVGASVARMMTWRARVMVPTVVLLALQIFPLAFPVGDGLSAALGLISLAVLLWGVPLWFVLVEAVFRTGQRAFGLRAGLGYATLTILLTFLFGLGVFVVPLLIQADIQRLRGNPRENSGVMPSSDNETSN
jgi:hypothetical protein